MGYARRMAKISSNSLRGTVGFETKFRIKRNIPNLPEATPSSEPRPSISDTMFTVNPWTRPGEFFLNSNTLATYTIMISFLKITFSILLNLETEEIFKKANDCF